MSESRGIYRAPGGSGDATADAANQAAVAIQAKLDAQAAAIAAASSENNATQAASTASNAATSSGNSATSASNSATAAATSASSAETAATNASTSATTATTKATEAATSATNATNSASAASISASNAASSATNASNSASAASISATNAASSATTASTSATSALNSASSASTSASNAATSETNAASSASSASSSAATATTQAGIATTKASEASTSASNAASSASAASTSASNALTSETNASNSASSASTSATNSANSATSASNSATAAATSATNASTSASTATTKASEAATSATNAATSATSAASSATSASNSASTATTQAGIATTKASEALTSANNAATSASNASSSASSAASAQSAAETARDQTLAAFDSFDDRYLGQKSTAPTVDNDGDPLVAGALYFNTTTNEMKVWDGSIWLNAYASLSGALLATNNLSDLNNKATARDNLGVEIGVDVQAYDADTTKNDVANTFTANQVISVTDNTNAALRVTQLGTGNAFVVEDSASPDATPFVINNAGNVFIGNTTSLSTSAADNYAAQLSGTSDPGSSLGLYRFQSNSGASILSFTKSRSATLGTNTAVINGDNLGIFQFRGADGTGYIQGATISAAVDGTPGTNDMPGRLVFSTTPDGSNTPVERMRIDSAGNVGIGTNSPLNRLSVSDSGTVNIAVSNTSDNITGIFRAGNAAISLLTEQSVPILFSTANTERMRITSAGDLRFNSGYGSVATAYGCRAWVNFDGTGTVAIRASGNVSSITDNGTGNYTINLTNAMPDTNYSLSGMARRSAAGFNSSNVSLGGGDTKSTTACQVRTGAATTAADLDDVSVEFFR